MAPKVTHNISAIILYSSLCPLITQFPEVCDYHDANYTVRLLTLQRQVVADLPETLYTQNSPATVSVEFTTGMEANSMYIAQVRVSTAVNSTTTEFTFSKCEPRV